MYFGSRVTLMVKAKTGTLTANQASSNTPMLDMSVEGC